MTTYGINYLAQTRAMREKPISHEEFLSDYCDKMFAEAAKPMSDLYELWNKCMRGSTSDHIEPSPFEYLRYIFTKKQIEKSISLCDQALNLTNHHLIRWRIERIRALVLYTEHNVNAPYEIFINIFRNNDVSDRDMQKAQDWIDQDGEHIYPHIKLKDNLFHAHCLKSAPPGQFEFRS